jgi:hypothetical protein
MGANATREGMHGNNATREGVHGSNRDERRNAWEQTRLEKECMGANAIREDMRKNPT